MTKITTITWNDVQNELPGVFVKRHASELDEVESVRILSDGVSIWHLDCEDHPQLIKWEDILLDEGIAAKKLGS